MAVNGVRDALVIAVSVYADQQLRALRSPARDAEMLLAVLGDPDIGDYKTVAVSDATSQTVREAIETFLVDRSPIDELLIYLSCHGIKDDDGRLHFAASDTNRRILHSTAVSAAFLREQMERSRARSIIVLLDCCYSGAFIAGSKGVNDSVPVQELAGSGHVVLTATSRTEYAFEGEISPTFPDSSVTSWFTASVVEGLRSGEADLDSDGRISVQELYNYVCLDLKKRWHYQQPQFWGVLQNQVFIASAFHRVSRPRQPVAGLLPWSRRRRGQDTIEVVEVGLSDTIMGCDRELRFQKAMICLLCDGVGAVEDPPSVKACGLCSGRGNLLGQSGDCAQCKGEGLLVENACPACYGDGRTKCTETLKLKVPPGVDTGTRILLQGAGEVGIGSGKPGNVYAEVSVRPHEILVRRGDDLHFAIEISQVQALTGGSAVLEDVTGQVAIAEWPPDVSDGYLVTFPGLGVTHLRPPEARGARGDMIGHIQVVKPDTVQVVAGLPGT